MGIGKLYKISKDKVDNGRVMFQENETNNFVEIYKSDCLLFLYSYFSYSGANYYFLFDNKIIYRHYAYEILEEVPI